MADQQRKRYIFGEYLEFERRSQAAKEPLVLRSVLRRVAFAAEIGVLGWLLMVFYRVLIAAVIISVLTFATGKADFNVEARYWACYSWGPFLALGRSRKKKKASDLLSINRDFEGSAPYQF